MPDLSVAILGDSLATGAPRHQPRGETFPEEFEQALEAAGLDTTVFDHAISGDTTRQALARLDEVLNDEPDLTIVELGTNDAIQRRDLGAIESNLHGIIEELQAAGSDVLLTTTFGFYPDRPGGAGYGNEATRDSFEAIFPRLANDLGVDLLDDGFGSSAFLGGSREGSDIIGGVLGDPGLNDDGLHPNAEGIDTIVARILPQTLESAGIPVIGQFGPDQPLRFDLEESTSAVTLQIAGLADASGSTASVRVAGIGADGVVAKEVFQIPEFGGEIEFTAPEAFERIEVSDGEGDVLGAVLGEVEATVADAKDDAPTFAPGEPLTLAVPADSAEAKLTFAGVEDLSGTTASIVLQAFADGGLVVEETFEVFEPGGTVTFADLDGANQIRISDGEGDVSGTLDDVSFFDSDGGSLLIA